MSRPLAAASYLAAMGAAGLLTATVAAMPFHGELHDLVFIVVALATASMAGALTPPAASFTTNREDGRR
ncbi:hypothetical protein ACWC3Y_11190 [Streptomyces sp. NPDC001296]